MTCKCDPQTWGADPLLICSSYTPRDTDDVCGDPNCWRCLSCRVCLHGKECHEE